MTIAYVKNDSFSNPFQYEVPDHVKPHEKVIVKTSHGIEAGEVIKLIHPEKKMPAIHHIERLMTKDDEKIQNKHIQIEKELKSFISKEAKTLSLNMNIIHVHISFDESYILVKFTSVERIDFRALVKLLSSTFHAKIEMRQIGPRDIAKLRGGIGPCGLLLCCSTFIGEFDAISIKMAKNQSLSLNPQNISGLCGKLLCCLKYEDETYKILKDNMPSVGHTLKNEYGEGQIIDINYIAKKAKIRHKDGYTQWIDVDAYQA